MFSRYEEEYKGLSPNGLLYAYHWKHEQLFDFLYGYGICNSFSTMRDWIYRRHAPKSKLIAIYKAYKEYSVEHPPQNLRDIQANIVEVDW